MRVAQVQQRTMLRQYLTISLYNISWDIALAELLLGVLAVPIIPQNQPGYRCPLNKNP